MENVFTYRIIKRYWRRTDTQEVKHYFVVQYLGETIFGRLKWKDHQREVCGWGDCFKEPAQFDSAREAQTYIDNLIQPVYHDEVVKVI